MKNSPQDKMFVERVDGLNRKACPAWAGKDKPSEAILSEGFLFLGPVLDRAMPFAAYAEANFSGHFFSRSAQPAMAAAVADSTRARVAPSPTTMLLHIGTRICVEGSATSAK